MFWKNLSYILGNPGMTHSVPTAFITKCSGFGIGHAWFTEDVCYDATRKWVSNDKLKYLFNKGFILQEVEFVLCWHMSFMFSFFWIKSVN